jgi:hypothetical protein
MSRGIDGRSIFIDDEDRVKFLELSSVIIRKSGFQCYAWALMDNHYHFLMRTVTAGAQWTHPSPVNEPT